MGALCLAAAKPSVLLVWLCSRFDRWEGLRVGLQCRRPDVSRSPRPKTPSLTSLRSNPPSEPKNVFVGMYAGRPCKACACLRCTKAKH